MVFFRTAAAAALARIESQRKDSPHFNTSLAAIKAQVQRELEAEKKAKLEQQSTQACGSPKVLTDEHNKKLAAQGVFFRYIFKKKIIYLFILSFMKIL